jgi:hypothetical protein
MKGAAAALADDLHRATTHTAWVTPVVVIWAPFEQRSLDDHGVSWVHGDELRDWLADQPLKLADGRRGQLAQAIRTIPAASATRKPSDRSHE